MKYIFGLIGLVLLLLVVVNIVGKSDDKSSNKQHNTPEINIENIEVNTNKDSNDENKDTNAFPFRCRPCTHQALVTRHPRRNSS